MVERDNTFNTLHENEGEQGTQKRNEILKQKKKVKYDKHLRSKNNINIHSTEGRANKVWDNVIFHFVFKTIFINIM